MTPKIPIDFPNEQEEFNSKMGYCILNSQGYFGQPFHFITLQNEDFKRIGKLISMCIVQGGPGFLVLHPAVNGYLVSGKYMGEITDDSDIRDLLAKVYKTI